MPRSIRAILAMLDVKKREQLQYAFEEGLTNQYVEYAPGRFIGVNVSNMPNLQIEQTVGAWSSGVILQGQVHAQDRDILPFSA